MTAASPRRSTDPSSSTDRELVITRFLNAPRELVFKAWTDPEHVRHWMGPRGYTAHHVKSDFRPGGAWRTCLRPDNGGEDLWQGGVYRKIIEPSLLEFTFGWDGDEYHSDHKTLVTVTFADLGGKTQMTFRQAIFESVEQRDGHHGGWNSTFDRLGEYLAGGISQGGTAEFLTK